MVAKLDDQIEKSDKNDSRSPSHSAGGSTSTSGAPHAPGAIPDNAENPASADAANRLHGIDAIRAIAILLVILLHSAIPYLTHSIPGLLWSTHDAASEAIQIHGAYGFSDEYDVERFMRNARGAMIYEGSNEIQSLIQADYALGYRKDKAIRCELPAYDPEKWHS